MSPRPFCACRFAPSKAKSLESPRRSTRSAAFFQVRSDAPRRHRGAGRAGAAQLPDSRANAEVAAPGIGVPRHCRSSQIDLDKLLQRVMTEANRILGAERSTLFLHD